MRTSSLHNCYIFNTNSKSNYNRIRISSIIIKTKSPFPFAIKADAQSPDMKETSEKKQTDVRVDKNAKKRRNERPNARWTVDKCDITNPKILTQKRHVLFLQSTVTPGSPITYQQQQPFPHFFFMMTSIDNSIHGDELANGGNFVGTSRQTCRGSFLLHAVSKTEPRSL